MTMTQGAIDHKTTQAPAYLYEGVIEFDAQAEGYQAEDMEQLLRQISKSAACLSTVVILKNAHYLTTKAFSLLHDYLQKHSTRVLMVLVSSDRSRIFPPLLECVVEG